LFSELEPRVKILFVKLGALGDVINTLPLAVNLKTRWDATIYWLVEPLSYPLIQRHPHVDHALLFDKHHWRTALPGVHRQLRAVRFDLTLELQRILKSGYFAWRADSRRRIGFDRGRCKELSWIFPFERIPAGDPHAHMLDQYLEFGDYLGLDRGGIRWDIPVDGRPPGGLPADYVVLNIGATKPANRWVPERFAGLAARIFARYQIPCVLTGGPEDRQRSERIAAAGGAAILDRVGKTSLAELVEVLNGARLVVSCDTGPMHLAVALSKPVVALFGPADPRRTGPYRGVVIQKALDCMPCNRRKCRQRDCMHAITVADVMEGVERTLAEEPEQRQK
jgi:ADP-heptose:LPS heptosyltransferase